MTNFIKDFISSKFAKILYKLSQPRCPNGHRCPDRIHCQYVFEGTEFKGIYCDIDTK